MKMLMHNLKTTLLIFLLVSAALLAGLLFQQYRSKAMLDSAAGENKQSLRNRYSQAGTIFDRQGIILAQSVEGIRSYAEDDVVASAVLQVVGDFTHNISNTIEASYQNTLLGTDRNPFRQLWLDLQGKGLKGDNITLTLDAGLSKRALELMGDRKGAIVLLNYQTGEILSSISTPTTLPEYVISYDQEKIPPTALFNRAFLGKYAPGSTFKVITAAAYINSGRFDPAFTLFCDRHSTVDPYGASESGDGDGHGTVNLAEAFSDSCNVFFGQVGVDNGKTLMLKEAQQMGYGLSLKADRLSMATSEIYIPDNASTLSWLSIGQPVADSKLSTSPLQLALLAGAIGNNGNMPKAHIVHHVTAPDGSESQKAEPQIEKQLVSPETAAILETLMIDVAQKGTGTAAAIEGYTVAAKTGTVQVEGQQNTALCIAYIVEESKPYAVAVVVEEGGAGGTTAAPLAGQMLSAALSTTSGQ